MKTYDERMDAVQRKIQRKRTQRRVLAATAGVLCLCIVMGIVLPEIGSNFNNEPNVGKYRDSEYIDVIQAINKYDSQNHRQEHTLGELLFGGVFGSDASMDWAIPDGAAPGDAPTANIPATGNSANSSVEITDHQVAGVLEADIIKRSQTHIFYLKDNVLEVYPIAGLETQLMSTWVLKSNEHYGYNNVEMYLSEDASTLTLVASLYGALEEGAKKGAYVQVISLDVSNPEDVKEVNSCFVSGSALSSRMVGDQLLMMTRFGISIDMDFDDVTTFIPQIGTPGNMECIPAEDIVIPEELSNKQFTVVSLLDSKTNTFVDCGAFLSFASEVYVSGGHIYATRNYTQPYEDENLKSYRQVMTEISCMSYGPEGLENKGAFQVEGSVKNQYSMDEYNGIFRVVTTTDIPVILYGGDGEPISNSARSSTNASLTCFRVGTWEQVGQVAHFAPDGETAESVRFDGNYAYVCTAVVMNFTDPVFFFDLTDPANITYKDTGTIDGYSSSLIQLNDGFLMGIGFNDQGFLKVEVYCETADGVASLCKYEQRGAFASDYKAYYIDRENNLFGIPTANGYILLQFDGYQLCVLQTVGIFGSLNQMRGVVIDKFLYVFSEKLEVAELW